MRIKGITYDTGTSPGGQLTRHHFDVEEVRHHMSQIAGALHCDGVRITGGDLDRIALATEAALAAGLEVWFSPHPCELEPEQMAALLDEAAERAEHHRSTANQAVALVLGCELSVFGKGFIPGEDAYARMQHLAAPPPELLADYQAIVSRLRDFLASSAARARKRFSGQITYAAGPWEPVDWSPFDIVAVDAYRDAANAATYADDIRNRAVAGKPLAITEFGCCTYRGAADRGALGWAVLAGAGADRQVSGELIRDEEEQARYLRDVLALLDRSGVDAAFWYTYANFDKPHRPDPGVDLDLASFGVVAVEERPGGSPLLRRKRASDALAQYRAATT